MINIYMHELYQAKMV